jgi:Emfourin
MKVTLSTHGGLAAGIRRPPLIVESSTLPKGAAAELAQLVAAVKAAPSVKEERPGRARDAMSYTITIEEDGGERSVINQSDTAMSPSFAALLEWLDRHSAGK